jgi:hypothetical protein
MTHAFKPCSVCGGTVQPYAAEVRTELPPGLYKTVSGALPVCVPAGQTWVQTRWTVCCTQCTTYATYLVIKYGDQIMVEKSAPADKPDGKKLTRAELLEKVRKLSENTQELESAKKAAAKDYGDQLKDVKQEMRDVLEQLKKMPA